LDDDKINTFDEIDKKYLNEICEWIGQII